MIKNIIKRIIIWALTAEDININYTYQKTSKKQKEEEKKRKKREYMKKWWAKRNAEKKLSKTEKRRLYRLKYHQRPEVKAKRHEYYQKWYARKKAAKSLIEMPTLNGFDLRETDNNGSLLN